MTGGTIHFERERRYRMSAKEAWRLLADTEHLNRTIGLPPVEFSQLPDSLLRRAQTKAYGVVPVRWREFPFDWIRERRYSVRREFESGPLAAVEGGIELTPQDGGVTVKAFADFLPRGAAGRVLWRLGRAPVTDLLDFCDTYLARRDSGEPDPIPAPKTRSSVDEARLERLLGQLRECSVREDLVAPLRDRVVNGSEDQLVRVRPYAVADLWGADRAEVLRLFLYATRAGLFELRWELMCPNCRIPKDEVDSLAKLPVQFHCETCGISYGADFDQSVELRFSVHPSVRPADEQIYCIGSPLRMPHILAQQYLGPSERRDIALPVEEPVRLRTVGSTNDLTISPAPPNPRVGKVTVSYAEGRWVGPHSLTTGDELALPQGAPLELRNQTGGPVLAVLEDVGWTRDATTAAQVTTLQEFRDLFSSEVLAPGRQHAVRHVALLFSDIKGSTRLYRGIGDAAAYGHVNRHFEFIKQLAAGARGAVVKTFGDGVMCAFPQLDDALEAAISMQEQVGSWCRAEGIDPPLVLKLGVHAGPVIAISANDRLDYFGRTVNVAARLGDQSRGGDVVLLRDVFEEASSAISSERASVHVEPCTGRLRGLAPEQELARLTVG
jgi:class 3 adenylate cyclase